jgi:hypothetical protein
MRLPDRYAGPPRSGKRLKWRRIAVGGQSFRAELLVGNEGLSIKPFIWYLFWGMRSVYLPWSAVTEVRRFREFPSTVRLFVPDVASSLQVSTAVFEAMRPHLDNVPVVWQTVLGAGWATLTGWINRKREEFDRREDAR